MKSKTADISLTQSSFVYCGKSIKDEDIKEEINEEESVDNPQSIQQETENRNICEDIKEEINEEESVNNPLTIQQEIETSVPSFNQKELGNVWLDYSSFLR